MKDMSYAAALRWMETVGREMQADFRGAWVRGTRAVPNIAKAVHRLCRKLPKNDSGRFDGASVALGFLFGAYLLGRAEHEPDEIDNIPATVTPTERPR